MYNYDIIFEPLDYGLCHSNIFRRDDDTLDIKIKLKFYFVPKQCSIFLII